MSRANTIKNTLGLLDSPVEPERWKRDIVLREAVRQQNLGPTYVRKPAESNLARLAANLGQFSSALKQYSDYQFKKGEIAQRGKAITHQELLEQHKLTQSKESLAQMGIRGGMINETAIQQEIRNETLARKNAELLQDIYISRLSVEEREQLALEIQHDKEVSEERLLKARKRVDDAQGKVPLSKDFFRDSRLKMLMGSGLAENYKDWITERVNTKLQEIRDGESLGAVDPEQAKAAVFGLFDEYMKENNIDPLSDFGKGFLSSVQAFNLDQLGDMANKVVKQTEGVADMQTKLGLIEHGSVPTPVFPAMEALDPLDADYSISSFEDLETLYEVVGQLNPRDRTAVARQLHSDGTSLELALQGGATSRQVRRAIQLAGLVKDKDFLDFVEPPIETAPWFNNLEPRPEETQQLVLRAAVKDVRLSPKKNLRLQDNLEKMGTLLEFDRRNFKDHPLYDELMHDLRQGIIESEEAANRQKRADLAAADQALANYGYWYSINMSPEDLQNLRAELYVPPGGTPLTKERLMALLEKHGPEWDDSPPALAMKAAITNLDPSGVVEFTDTLQRELVALSDNKKNVEKGWLEFQTWYTPVATKPIIEDYVRALTTEGGTVGADATKFIKRYQTKDVLDSTRPEHMGLTDTHIRQAFTGIMKEQEAAESTLVAQLRKQHPEMPSAEFSEVVRESLVELQNGFKDKVRDYFVNERKSREAEDVSMDEIERKALLAHYQKQEIGVALETLKEARVGLMETGAMWQTTGTSAFNRTPEGKALAKELGKERVGWKDMMRSESGQKFFEDWLGLINHRWGGHHMGWSVAGGLKVPWGGPTKNYKGVGHKIKHGTDIKEYTYRDIDYDEVDNYFAALTQGMGDDTERLKGFVMQHEIYQGQLSDAAAAYTASGKTGSTPLWKQAADRAGIINKGVPFLWWGDEPDDAAIKLKVHMDDAQVRIEKKLSKVASLSDILSIGMSKERAAAAGGVGVDYVVLSPSHFLREGSDRASAKFLALTRDQAVTIPRDFLSKKKPLITGLIKKELHESTWEGKFMTVEELSTELGVPRNELQLAAEVMGYDTPEAMLEDQRSRPYYRALDKLRKNPPKKIPRHEPSPILLPDIPEFEEFKTP